MTSNRFASGNGSGSFINVDLSDGADVEIVAVDVEIVFDELFCSCFEASSEITLSFAGSIVGCCGVFTILGLFVMLVVFSLVQHSDHHRGLAASVVFVVQFVGY